MSARGYFGALAKARRFWAAENARYFGARKASAIEARSAETTGSARKGESAVPKADAQ